MHHPENIRQLHRGYRLIHCGGLALIFFWGVNFCSLDAAVVKLVQGTSNLVASSAEPTAGHSQNNQNAVVANTPPVARALTPIPEISILFPIIGLVVAISLTQLLRRRRIAQQRSRLPNRR